MKLELKLLKHRFFVLSFIVSGVLTLLGLSLLIIKYGFIPPVVPLWYSKPWGEKQLGTAGALSLLPALSTLFIVINLAITEFFVQRRERISAIITTWINLVVVFLLNMSLYKIISSTASPSTLPPILQENIFIPFLTAFLFAVSITPLVIRFAEKYGLVDNPVTHKHPGMLLKEPTPRAGTLPAFLALAVVAVFFYRGEGDVFAGILLAGTLTTVIGLLDDKFDVNPYIRLVSLVLAMIIVVISGVHVRYIGDPLGKGFLPLDIFDLKFDLLGTRHFYLPGDILMVIWGVWMMNMLSWSNGVDGQFPGIVTIAAAIIGVLAQRNVILQPGQEYLSTFSFITAGAILGTLPFTWHPSKMLYGFGATTFGLILATLAVLSVAKVSLTLLVLSVPTIDAVFAIIRRVKKGQSPVWGDRGHLHHKLLDMGWSQRQVALFYWGITFFLGLVALYSSEKDIFIAALSGATLAAFILVLANLDEGKLTGLIKRRFTKI